ESGKFAPYLARDFAGYHALQPQRIAEATLVVLRPHVHLVFHPDQLCRDAQLFAVTADAALQHIVDAELAPDRADALQRILERHAGGARHHAQPAVAALVQLRGDFLGETVDEVFAVFAGAVAIEGQHRDRGVVERRRSHRGDFGGKSIAALGDGVDVAVARVGFSQHRAQDGHGARQAALT